MMPSKATFYGVVAALVMLLIVSSVVGGYYYGEYQQERATQNKYVSEANTALTEYRSLLNSYNESLAGYNQTLSLLADAVANLNTSTPAYAKASSALSTLWSSYRALASEEGGGGGAYLVDMLVDFGNGTTRWYNDSAAQPGWNAYLATVVILNGEVQATWYPQFGEHFISAIDGASGSASRSWFVWVLGSEGWEVSQTGADGIQVVNGTAFAWTLCGYDASFKPSCSP